MRWLITWFCPFNMACIVDVDGVDIQECTLVG